MRRESHGLRRRCEKMPGKADTPVRRIESGTVRTLFHTHSSFRTQKYAKNPVPALKKRNFSPPFGFHRKKAYFCPVMEAHAPTSSPAVAVITENTLEGLGLIGIIERMMPGADVRLFPTLEAARQAGGEADFFHYFISSATLLQHAAFFVSRRRTIVLTHGEERLPVQGMHTLNICQPEQGLVRDILLMAHAGHRHIPAHAAQHPSPALTPRERDVLRLVALGHINKEIADRLGVGVSTVISHRKNLTRKLGIKSVSGLTIYAATNGIVRVEEV